MNMNLSFLSLSITVLLFAACAHHRDVRPGADGINKVVVASEDEESGAQNALSQARHYCESKNKEAAIVSEGSKYIGSMDESTYKNIKTGSKVASAVGGAGMVFGGKNEKNAGGLLAIGGTAGTLATGNGYNYTMTFKCQ